MSLEFLKGARLDKVINWMSELYSSTVGNEDATGWRRLEQVHIDDLR